MHIQYIWNESYPNIYKQQQANFLKNHTLIRGKLGHNIESF